MPSTLANESVGDILGRILDTATGAVLVVDPTAQIVDELISVANEVDDPPAMRLLAGERGLKDVMEDFLVASNTADLVDHGVLELHTADPAPGNSVIISEETLTAIVSAGNELAAVTMDEDGFVEFAWRYYDDRWTEAEPFNLRTPPLSRVRKTLETEIGSETARDFNNVLESLETARGDGQGLDEVTISLLVAAKNDALLYDISKWGEDVGIASKATFSRTKTKLEELGLLATEKVPIDVGRPRLRLKLAHERLHNASSTELASVAQSLLG